MLESRCYSEISYEKAREIVSSDIRADIEQNMTIVGRMMYQLVGRGRRDLSEILKGELGRKLKWERNVAFKGIGTIDLVKGRTGLVARFNRCPNFLRDILDFGLAQESGFLDVGIIVTFHSSIESTNVLREKGYWNPSLTNLDKIYNKYFRDKWKSRIAIWAIGLAYSPS